LALSDQGKYEEVEEMHRQVLRLLETVLSKEHHDVLSSMNNLAGVLRDQGKYGEAEEMYRQVLRSKETMLGKEHPSTLRSMNSLGGVLRASTRRRKRCIDKSLGCVRRWWAKSILLH
jgi:tetratricopeptide (TPR) repeat protein